MSFLIGAVDVVAQPANIYVDPIFDYSAIGIPFWFWLLVLIGVILIISNFWWIYKRICMRPVLGYLEARKAGAPQTLFLGKNRAFMIRFLEYVDGVLAYKDITQVARWLVQSPKSVGRLGGLSVLMVRDSYDYSLDPVSEIAICRLATEWNQNHDDTEQLNNFSDFEKLRSSGKLEEEYPEGVAIPLYSVYDPSLIQKYLPTGRSAGTFGSHLLQKAKDMRADKTQERWYEKYLPLGIALSVAIVMMVLSYMFATGGF
jgi:hypothetical protein